MVSAAWRRDDGNDLYIAALYNPVTILGGGRDLADMQDTRDMENTGNIGNIIGNLDCSNLADIRLKVL